MINTQNASKQNTSKSGGSLLSAHMQQKKIQKYQQQNPSQNYQTQPYSTHLQQNPQRQSMNAVQQQDQMNVNKMGSQNKQNLRKLKENQEEAIDQLNQFMEKYSGGQQQQTQQQISSHLKGSNLKQNSQVSSGAMRDTSQRQKKIKDFNQIYILQKSILQANRQMKSVLQKILTPKPRNKSSRISNQQKDIMTKLQGNEMQLRMSTLGYVHDTEQEDYEQFKHFANDYLEEENDIQLPKQYQEKQSLKQSGPAVTQNQKQQVMQQQHHQQQQPQISKSPNPNLYNTQMVSTPTSLQAISSQHQNPMMFLNQFNQQQNQRNSCSNINMGMGFKSHQVNQIESGSNTNLIREKKKSVSIANTYQTVQPHGNTFSSTSISGNTKSYIFLIEQQINSIISSGAASSIISSSKVHSQAHTANTSKEPHKKSQSLYNKKIVEIISGLQQSLGVIANNVQNSFNNNQTRNMCKFIMSFGNQFGLFHYYFKFKTEESIGNGQVLKSEQQKALLESALLAQKIAQMTQGMRKDSGAANNPHIQKNSKIDKIAHQVGKDQSSKRKSMKINRNLSERGSLNILQIQNGRNQQRNILLNYGKFTHQKSFIQNLLLIISLKVSIELII